MRLQQAIRILVSLLIVAPLGAQTLGRALRCGTVLQVKLDTTVNTQNTRVGDGVAGRLIKPVLLNGEVVLPVGSDVRGRVRAVRAADRKQKIAPALRVTFDEIVLPSGRAIKAQASLVSFLGFQVDASGELTNPIEFSKRKIFCPLLVGVAVDAGIGALIAHGEGAIIGAAIGGVIAVPILVMPRPRWYDLYLRKGTQVTLRLDQDLSIP